MGVDIIRVITHYPQSDKAKQALKEKVAAVHADTVTKYVSSLNISSLEKERLVKKILDTYEPS